MSHIFSSGEIIGRFTRDLQEFEVCAAAEAGYDESKSQLVLDLDCFLRLADIRAKNQRLVADWLPCKQTVR